MLKASGKTDEARTISDLSGLQNTDKRSMNSRQVLRVVHGAWNLHQNGEWRFERKTNDLGFPAIVRTNGNEDPSFEGEAEVASQAVLEEYFNDQEMMVFHRVHLEMERAKLNLKNQRCYQLVHGNEIIVIDDTDSDSDGTEPLGLKKLSITVFNTGSSSNQESPFPTNRLIISDEINDVAKDSEYIPQPNVSNDSPMEYYEGIPVQFAVDKDLFQQNGTTNVDHANSSTDSAPNLNEVNNVVLSWENVPDNLSNTQPIYDNPVVSEGVLDDALVIYNGETMPQNSASVDLIPATNNSHSISATAGLIPNLANADDKLVINLDDSSSEDSMDSVIDTDDIIELTGQFSELDMLPPSTRRPPGRPRKKRFLSRGEVRMKTPRRRTMSTPLRVSLYHGAWQRNDDGYWIFQRKPSDLGYTVLVKPNESFEDLETIIRDRYKLKPETPLAMAYHPPEWMLEPDGTRRPPITVSTTFEFLNKTTFTVAGATFVFNGYNDRELVASKDVLEEIFTEHEMVSIYRAHLEITNARQNQQENAAESSVSSSKINQRRLMHLDHLRHFLESKAIRGYDNIMDTTVISDNQFCSWRGS
ncbi:hypothetical protein HID58_072451 [Brassica napus]|uniref:Uncharacterized protein n=1 Tax=Brassica napus TaxID=3708 RepID=A0ABQ7Z4G3_BRANA|nr:hypothetical protein HID58_072451 [Brassica napus]